MISCILVIEGPLFIALEFKIGDVYDVSRDSVREASHDPLAAGGGRRIIVMGRSHILTPWYFKLSSFFQLCQRGLPLQG